MAADARTDADQAIDELAVAVRSVPSSRLDAIAAQILRSAVVVCHGVGREGLVMKGLTMRLFHAGVDAHALGEMTTPAVGDGDLVVLSIGPGRLPSVETFGRIARSAGAGVLVFTAQPELLPDDLADDVAVVRAQTMASDGGSDAVLPMGSAYEIALLVLVDLITHRVRDGRSETPEEMRGRHTNLE